MVGDYETPVKRKGLGVFVKEGPDDPVIFASLWKFYDTVSDMFVSNWCMECRKFRILDWLISNGHVPDDVLAFAFRSHRRIGDCSDGYKRIIEATNWEPFRALPLENDEQYLFWKRRRYVRRKALVVLFIAKQPKVGVWRDVLPLIARCVWGARGYYKPEKRLKKKKRV